jgi:serine/threonine protein phosphatase 1
VTRRLYAIGDLHGYADSFDALYSRLLDDGLDPDRDTVIFLGDYVDRGPDSRRVVETVMALTRAYPHWRALRGNHEQLMIDALHGGPMVWAMFTEWWYQGGRETVASFAGVPASVVVPGDAWGAIPADVVAWLDDRPHSLLHGRRYAFAHAGFRPGPTWFNTDPHDTMWIRDEFLDSDFDFEGRIIVHGHTPVHEPVVRPNRIGIDTVLMTGQPTAVELSGPAPRFLRAGSLSVEPGEGEGHG